jgi:hypothetical protein
LELLIFSVFAKCLKMLKVGDLNQNPTGKRPQVGESFPLQGKFIKVSALGFEPRTNGLKGHCSAVELRAPKRCAF